MKEIQYFYNTTENESINKLHSLVKHLNIDHKVEKICDKTNPNIALFCTDLPRKDFDSGSRRLIEILSILKKIGCNIYIFTHNTWSDKYFKECKQFATDIISHDISQNKYLNAQFENIQISKQINFDVIYYYGYEMHQSYNKYIYYLSPNSKVILDSIDVHWSRLENSPEACKEKIQRDKNLEIESYTKSDVVLAVTESDKSKIQKFCKNANIKILSNIHHKNFLKLQNSSNRCIFIGGEHHTPNREAVKKAISIVKTYNTKSKNTLYLDIVGKYTDKEIIGLEDKNIVFHQTIDDKELERLYRQCKFSLCPLTWGSGIKGKICEAICYGVPVITSDVGNEGIGLQHNTQAFICNTEQEYLDAIDTIMSYDKKQLDNLTENAYQKLSNLIGPVPATQILESCVTAKPIVLSILTHNNAYLLEKLLDSIFLHTRYPNFHIHITSDKCRDSTRSMVSTYIKKYPNLISYTYNTKNLYYIISHNNVIKKYHNADIVLMNEDIEIITKDWLSILYNAAYSSFNVGTAGGKSIDGNGKISEAGAELYNDGSGKNIGRGMCRYDPQYNSSKYTGYVSGCLLYMKRNVIDQLGVMDTSYYPCYYEDSDWQYNMHINGYKTLYVPQCEFIHREGSSCGTSTASGLKQSMIKNKKKFASKYSDYNIEHFNY